jgi:hypothetical protein
MSYYKFEWKWCNNYCEDGGKYLRSEWGIFFARNDDPIFELARICNNFLLEMNSDSDSDSEVNAGIFNCIETAASIIENRVPITEEEYNTLRRILGPGIHVSSCADSGGMSINYNKGHSILIAEIKEALRVCNVVVKSQEGVKGNCQNNGCPQMSSIGSTSSNSSISSSSNSISSSSYSSSNCNYIDPNGRCNRIDDHKHENWYC